MDNIKDVKLKKKKSVVAQEISSSLPSLTNKLGADLHPERKTARELLKKYQKQYFNNRNNSLGKLVDTTERVLGNNQKMNKDLNKMLDRVELDRPFLFRDKIKTVASHYPRQGAGANSSSPKRV